jgi:hypothetical protein
MLTTQSNAQSFVTPTRLDMTVAKDKVDLIFNAHFRAL